MQFDTILTNRDSIFFNTAVMSASSEICEISGMIMSGTGRGHSNSGGNEYGNK